MFRRSFSTTARLLRKSNGKHPPQGRNEPPRPPNNGKPEERQPPKEELNKAQSELRERILGTFIPRSEHFIFAFANARLSKEKRTKSGLLLITATLLALLTEPYFYEASWAGGSSTQTQEEGFLDAVRVSYSTSLMVQ